MQFSWLRLWHDMPSDLKWRVIAKRSGQPIAAVLSTYMFMLVNASSNEDERGRLRDFDCEQIAVALDMETEQIETILSHMQGIVLDGDYLSGWKNRQPKREDDSAERARLWRERNRTQPNAKRTQTTAPEIESESESDIESDSDSPSFAHANGFCHEDEFEGWYQAFPRHVGKGQARKAYKAARKKADPDELLTGAQKAAKRYRDSEPRFIPHPATWLNGERWLDDEKESSRRLSVVGEYALE